MFKFNGISGTYSSALTVQEFATLMHMSYRGVLLLIKQERVKAVKVGKQWIITHAEAERVLKEGA